MKKIVMTMGAFFALSGAMAQGPYVSLSVGYAGAASSEVIGTKYDVSQGPSAASPTTPIKTTTSNIVSTYGGGVPVTLGLGYMITEHLGVDLGINYFAGSEVTSSVTTTYFGSESKTTSKGYQIRVVPQLVFSTGNDNALGFYAKSGLVLPVSGATTFKVNAIDASSMPGTLIPTDVEGESSGAFSLGYTGTIGASFNLKDNLAIFGELQGISLRIKGESQTITSYKVNGNEIISTLPASATTTNYVDQLNEMSNTDPLKPAEALRNSTNYSSFGFNLGVKFSF